MNETVFVDPCDHDVWGPVVHNHDTVEGFASTESWEDGVHIVHVPGGPHIDLLINGLNDAVGTRSLPVFFNGAVTGREEKHPPFFSGVRIASQLRTPYVAISDPTLSLNNSIGLGWYAGNQHADFQDKILALLRVVHKATQRELLLVGGSGGGFAALNYGHKLGQAASVFVWNPQTDVTLYNEKFVKHYANIALGIDAASLAEPAWQQVVREKGDSLGITLDVNNSRDSVLPRRLFYLQNSEDWHVAAHLRPFVEGRRFTYLTGGRYSLSPNHQLLIATFGAGHAPPSPEVVAFIIDRMVDPSLSVEELVLDIRKCRILGKQASERMPRDLEWLRDRLSGLATFKASLSKPKVRLELSFRGVPYGYGGMVYEFLSQSGGQQTQLQSFSPEPVFEGTVASAGLQSGASFSVRVRDGFGNELFQRSVDADFVRPKNVVVYGSSASSEPLARTEDLSLVSHIARTSLGSFYQSEVPLVRSAEQNERMTSFQRQIMDFDLDKAVLGKLKSTYFDLLVVDLIDERFPLLKFSDTLITNTPELRAAQLDLPAGLASVEWGSVEHISLCRNGIQRLVEAVGGDRIVVNKLFWAYFDSAGQALDQREEIERNNEFLAKLYEEFQTFDSVRFLEYPSGIFIAATHHKWGRTPYRYEDELNRLYIEHLRAT